MRLRPQAARKLKASRASDASTFAPAIAITLAGPAEHHIELRVSDDERVAAVDDGDVNALAALGKQRRELEARTLRGR